MITMNDNKIKLFFLTIALVMIGLMFVYSAGSLQAVRLNKNDMFFLIKQVISCFIGFIALITAYNIPLNFYRKNIMVIYFLALFLLILVFFQKSANGAHRWIMLPIFSFQPSEFAKFAVVVYLAHYLDKKYDKLFDFSRGFLPATLLIGVLAALILIEPDFGTTFLIILVAFTMFIVGGAKARHIMGVFVFSIPILVASLLVGYRKGRLLTFLDPWSERFDSGYQLVQSLAAVGNGGILGKGIGNSTQKLFFLPEAHTDFIFAIISEELGLLGSIVIIFLIVYFFWLSFKAAFQHTDRYKKLLMVGITCTIFYQSTINLWVVLGMLPTKGITLPFISYGGSALMMFLFFTGVILRGMYEAEKDTVNKGLNNKGGAA